MAMNLKILTPSDIDQVLSFERDRLEGDDLEKSMAEWSSLWREEALRHYLPLGWSMGIENEKKELVSYFLGQVLLFVEGMTQTLWVENIGFKNDEALHKIIDSAIRYARDKHLQRVMIPKQFSKNLIGYKVSGHQNEHVEVLTSKINR
ncbi:MAG: hypothetical protein KDD25_02095 [Bdellovibrionales bacterium]|nr:hypothetical protein [Bdellovibrionales bacterium]